MIDVLIVDDHAVVRHGIRKLLEEDKELRVIAEADSGETAVQLVKELVPEVVLMDIKMPGIGGFEASCRILRYNPDIKVLVLTSVTNDLYPTRFIKAGAAGYLTKNSEGKELIKAIKAVSSGQRYISWEISNQMACNSVTKNGKSSFDTLSRREMQVVFRIIKGRKAKEIASEHYLSSKTVNSYRYRIFEKLGIRNDVELTLMAIRHGLIDVDEADIAGDAD